MEFYETSGDIFLGQFHSNKDDSAGAKGEIFLLPIVPLRDMTWWR